MRRPPRSVPLDDHLKGYVSDCPVQPDVWRRYREDGPGTTQTLIAQVRPGDSPPMVATKLRDWFDARELITHANYVLVEANFDEMVTRLLPLTGWSNFVRRAAALTLARLRAEVAEVSAVQGSHRLAEGLNSSKEDWGAEDRARLRWLVSMIVMTDGLGDEGSTSVDLDTRVTHLLREASDAASSEFAPLAAVGFNRPVRPAVAQSRVAVKADAAERVFNVDCCAITWAVVDTGIARNHPAFAGDDGKSRVVHTFDVGAGIEHLKDKQKDARFVALLDDQAWEIFRDGALVTGENADRGRSVDARTEHGTHVAGILGAKYERPARPPRSKPGEDTPDGDLFGICPTIRLVDVRVFDEDETGSEFNVLVALAFIRWLNERQRLGPDGRIDGVNISLSVPFAVDSHACGWTPVCQECDRLVKSGVVVVVAAGNAGFVEGQDESLGTGFALVSIADPGNAEAVITVGATHSTEPHRYGPMARSARGPTADGRHKPDLLAPGSRILGPAPAGRWQRMSGTSMAAPHVSGVAAMLLARFPELRGQPERVKDILCETATDLGRLPDFQGHGLLDALRALQSE